MATTYNTFTGDNSTVDFAFTFPYLNTTDIKVSLDKVVQTLTTHYTLHNATTIRFGSAPGTGVAIKIYRDTDSSSLPSTFYPGSSIRSGDLNDNFTQNLYVTQEAENDVADTIRLSDANTFTAIQTYDNNNEIRFRELTTNGTAYVGLKGATDKGAEASYTISLPADAPTANQVLKADASTPTNLTWADDVLNSTHVTATDNESTDENNLITFVEGATTSTGNVGLEMDGDFHYNPSSGTVTATVFKGDIDANDGDFDGTLEADAITVGGTALNTVIAGVTVTNATNSSHVLVTDNESTNEENLVTFVEGATDSTGNVGLEMDGNLTYNPSTGTLTSTVFKGDIDANDGDFDGTLEADAITVGGTALNTVIAGVTVTNATNAAHVSVADNESTDENNLITFIEDTSATGNVGLESDGDFHYNPSSGTVSATIFKGDIDANDGDFDGTLEADAITVGGTALNTVIAGVTVTNATNATNSSHVLVTDNESTNEENLVTFVEGATDSTGNVGLEMDGNLTYNPSTGTLSSTVFKGDIDANDGDFDGTLEADAITVGGTALNTVIAGVTVTNATNAAHVSVADNESTDENNLITFIENASATGNVGLESDGDFHYNPSTGKLTTTAIATSGAVVIGGGLDTVGQLTEACTVTAGKLSDNLNLDLEDGNVWLFTTQESTTATPNLRWNSSTTLTSKMSVGDSLAVTIITTAHASGYSAQLTIDGGAVTENWVGGSAPAEGGSSGKDIHSYTIIKTGTSGTANNDFTVIANHSKTS